MASYNERAKSLVEALITLTQKERIQWINLSRYVRNNQNLELRNYLVENNRYIYSINPRPVIDEYDSFCSNIEGGMVFLFSFKARKAVNDNDYVVCAIQDKLSGNIVAVSNEGFLQDECIKLKEYVLQISHQNGINELWDKIIAFAQDENKKKN